MGNILITLWYFVIIIYSFLYIKWHEINMTVPSIQFNMFLRIPMNEFSIGLLGYRPHTLSISIEFRSADFNCQSFHLSACQWISTLNRWLERNAHKQRANVNGVGRDWNVGSLILVELPVWRNEDRQSESYTSVVKVAISQNSAFQAEKFYCKMFRLMYKKPSSGWQGPVGKLWCRTPCHEVLKGSYQAELHLTRY